MRMTGIALGLCVALAATAALAGEPKAGKSQALATKFEFLPKKPGYQTTLFIFRNPKKLRPLFVTGNNEKGLLDFKPADLSDLGTIAGETGEAALAGLVDNVQSTGEFTVKAETFSAAKVDIDRYVGTAWLRPEKRAPVTFTVHKLTDWAVDKSFKTATPDLEYGYTARCTATLNAGIKPVQVQVPVRIAVGYKGGASFSLRSEFTFKGADAGLDGDDAGEIKVTVWLKGVSTLANETKNVLNNNDTTDTDSILKD